MKDTVFRRYPLGRYNVEPGDVVVKTRRGRVEPRRMKTDREVGGAIGVAVHPARKGADVLVYERTGIPEGAVTTADFPTPVTVVTVPAEPDAEPNVSVAGTPAPPMGEVYFDGQPVGKVALRESYAPIETTSSPTAFFTDVAADPAPAPLSLWERVRSLFRLGR